MKLSPKLSTKLSIKLSIIIPAKNEEHYIARTLAAVKQQCLPGDEIIVVADACRDKTIKIARQYTKNVFAAAFNNVSKTRNYGARKAKGDVLVFLDADTLPGEKLFATIREASETGYIGGITRTVSLENIWKAHIIWLVGNLGRFFFLIASGMFFCRKDMFFKVKGYDEEKTVAEDTYLILKLKKLGKLCYLWRYCVKTSARRMEQQGYLKTIYHQFRGFFQRGFNEY